MKKILLFLGICSPLALYAQGFQVNLQGQKQQAMGGAGTGTALDAASIFFNPGAVSLLNKNSVSAGVSLTSEQTAFRDQNSQQQFRTKSPISPPFTVYGIFGALDSSKLKFGLGVYTPFGSTIAYEEGWSGRFTLTQMKLLSVFVQPTVSYRINEKLGIGAGFVYGYGAIDLRKDLPITNTSGQFASAQLKGHANGLGFNLGVYYQPVKVFSVGVSYRSGVKMKVSSGDAIFNVPGSLSTNFPTGKFSASLPLPQVLAVGIGLYPTDRLTIGLDFNYILWSSYKSLQFDYEQNTPSLKDTDSPRNYKNTIALRAGAQYRLHEKWFLRVGTTYEKSPIQEGYVTPEIPDSDRLNFTGGIGFSPGSHIVLDFSFSYINFSERMDTNAETLLSGTYKSRILVPGLSLTYNF